MEHTIFFFLNNNRLVTKQCYRINDTTIESSYFSEYS